MGKELAPAHRERAEETLLAMKKFKEYLEKIEKDLSRVSKKRSTVILESFLVHTIACQFRKHSGIRIIRETHDHRAQEIALRNA